MTTLALSIIVKNASLTIEKAIKPLKNICDEIIAVDTGSTDNTKKILNELGAIIIEEEWRDDFSYHRNTALNAATAEWILSIDADEWFIQDDAVKIKTLIETQSVDAWIMSTINFVNYSDEETFNSKEIEERIAPYYKLSSKVRLFRKGNIKWEGKVHELVDFSAAQAGYKIARSSIMLRHSGLLLKSNSEYYVKLAKASYVEGNYHPGILVLLSNEAAKLGELKEAEELLLKALKMEPRFPLPYSSLSKLFLLRGKINEAEKILLQGLEKTNGAPEILHKIISFYNSVKEYEKMKTMRILSQKLHPEIFKSQ